MLVKSNTTGEYFTACLLHGDATNLPRWAITHAWNTKYHGSYLIRDQEGERSMVTPMQFETAYTVEVLEANIDNCMSLAERLLSYAVRLAAAPAVESKLFLLSQMLESTEALAQELDLSLKGVQPIEGNVAANAAILFLAAAIVEDVTTEPIDALPLVLDLYAHLIHAGKGNSNG